MPNEEVNEVAEKPAAPTPDAANVSTAILHSILNDRQKRKLGLLPKKEPTEKEVARLEALRERMRAINNARKEQKLKKIPEVKLAPKVVKKRKQREPSESEDSEESEESEDQYVQKKARKVNQTLKQLSKVEQHMAHLRQANQQNPFFNLLCR